VLLEIITTPSLNSVTNEVPLVGPSVEVVVVVLEIITTPSSKFSISLMSSLISFLELSLCCFLESTSC